MGSPNMELLVRNTRAVVVWVNKKSNSVFFVPTGTTSFLLLFLRFFV